MITITKKEEVVLNQIKIFIKEYSDGIPIELIRKEVDFHEYDLIQILNTLSDKDLIQFDNDVVLLTDSEKEINADQKGFSPLHAIMLAAAAVLLLNSI